MVRLKGFWFDLEVDNLKFQFHDGSIKGISESGSMIMASLFQFHDGSIKGDEENLSKIREKMFQFHDGSIKGLPKQLRKSCR